MPYYTVDSMGSDCFSWKVKEPSRLLECEGVTRTREENNMGLAP
jgi:hypothetical protein